jgi:hypothetical protein
MKRNDTLPSLRLALGLGVALLLGAGNASAQLTKTIPFGVADTDGSSSTAYFSGYGGGRTQQIVAAGALTSGAGLIREIRLRPDAGSLKEPARILSNMTLRVSQTTVTPQGMSATFANNITGTPSTVWTGTINLPAPNNQQTFSTVFKFSQPFVFVAAQGNLLLDWELAIPPTKSGYFFDCHKPSTTEGGYQSFGSGGPFAVTENYVVSSDAQKLTPGGSMLFEAAGFSKQYPGIVAFGWSNTSYGPIPLPFDLAAIGAPQNVLYTSFDLLLPVTWGTVGGRNVASASFPIPNAQFEGLRTFAQALFLDSGANSAGIVTTSGLEMQLPFSTPIISQVGDYRYQQASGRLTMGTGLVLEIEGTLP